MTANKIDFYPKVFTEIDYPLQLFEAFSGIGCQALALKKIGIPYVNVGISEIDKFAIKSYEAIHGETKNYGDICKMVEIPPCDIFTWSFPCTDLSVAGKQKGMGDTRSGLVYEVLRLLKVTKNRPRVLIMENVPPLVQKKFKAEFCEIQKEIEAYGYKNFTQLLNAKDYGVAQNRNRVFMVSILNGERYEFPPKEELKLCLKDYLEESVAEKYYLSEKAIMGMQTTNYASAQEKNRVVNPNEICGTIRARDFKDPKCVVGEPFIQQIAHGYNLGGNKELCPPITTSSWQDNNHLNDGLRIRKLTPKECFRLQGISDEDFYKAQAVVSNSQLYKQAGNGIVVDVFAKILKGLFLDYGDDKK